MESIEWEQTRGRRGETVIDYGLRRNMGKTSRRIHNRRKSRSDHLPLEISIEETNNEERRKGRAKEEQKKVRIKISDGQGLQE
jgi:hypothetical protein